MLPKPNHLGPEYAAQFQDASVAQAYANRPPYPAEVFALLAALLPEAPRTVLDVGCGTGAIAREMVAVAARVDAVDPSAAMLARGRLLPAGDSPRLRWICGYAEDAPLDPPYELITAGSSLHWMEWSVVLPRLRDALAPGSFLAIVNDVTLPSPWDTGLLDAITTYSTNRDYQPYDLIAELEARGLFRSRGRRRTAPVPFAQPVDAYIESFHARNGFSRDRMHPDAAAHFDSAVRALVTPFCPDGIVRMEIAGEIVWGEPAPQTPGDTAEVR